MTEKHRVLGAGGRMIWMRCKFALEAGFARVDKGQILP